MPQNEGENDNVVRLDRSSETINITELEPQPSNGRPVFIGKTIDRDGVISQYPNVTWWQQRVASIPATVFALYEYLREARTRNICLIRGAPANLERQPTRRLRAFTVERGKERGDHGFIDEPTRLFPLDVDGIAVQWRADPEGAIKHIATLLGEPWASSSFVWFFSATHGLELDQDKRWTGRISDGRMRVRLVFITDRALTTNEADALTKIARVRMPQLDPCVIRVVQPNYIKRPLWMQFPHLDPLGGVPSIGRTKGKHEYLAVPNYLTEQARWAKAQGHDTDIADHDDAEAAVRGVGSDGRIRSHLLSAVMHLLEANPPPDVVSFADHVINIVAKLQQMVAQHRSEIEANLSPYHRPWADVLQNLPDDMIRWAHWLLDHPNALRRKTVRLTKEQRAEADEAATREAIFERVARAIERALHPDPFAAVAAKPTGTPQAELLVAPTGSRKSTLMRAHAVRYVAEYPGKSVMMLVPRHELGNEQIGRLREEHPNGGYRAAVWRGRHADDPESPDPKDPTGEKLLKMCQRSDEAKKLEEALLDVDHHLCRQGRGEKVIKCSLFDVCGYQRQKQTVANVWFAAHECMVHEMPKAFGDVGVVMIDESPLDAFMFGVDANNKMTLVLDDLQSDVAGPALREKQLKMWGWHDMRRRSSAGGANPLSSAHKKLYKALDKLIVPINHHLGVPIPYKSLGDLPNRAREFHQLEWREKTVPDIKPGMSDEEVEERLTEASDNHNVKKKAILWELIEQATPDELIGRIQIHRGDKGRLIRLVGLHPIAKGWNVRTLVCDATGDAELLKAIWPHLHELEPRGWEQLPRPNNVRIFQVVDRSISKWAVAVEGKNEKEMQRKVKGARRMYAALLMQAMQYGGAPVAAIVYKSTEEWIRKNCYVPPWLKLMHHGAITGTNILERVRALFVIGRPLASAEDIVRQAEALFGAYIAEREYANPRKHGRIPIEPDGAGNDTIKVDVRPHPHLLAERLRRQVTEASQIQTEGRARAGLRGEAEPLDIHRWHDVPLPELGPVKPVLWGEVDAGLDGLMLAVGGVWLESIPDAVRAYPGLFSADGLKSARRTTEGVSLIIDIIGKTPSVVTVWYQKRGERQRPRRAVVLPGTDARAWLEGKLGPLSRYEEVAVREARAQK